VNPAPAPALVAALRRLDPRLRVEAVRPLAGGISARVLALDVATASGPERWVLRIPPDDEDLDAGAEHALLVHLHGAGLPVPEPLARIPADPDAGLPRDAVLTRFVEHDGAVPVPAGGLERMAHLLADLHDLDPGAVPALPAWAPLPVPDALPALDPAVATPLLAASRAAPPPADGDRCLCHRDLWPGNLLWRGREIAALLDWEEARLADPLEDLAVARLELAWLMDRPRVERFTRAWCARRGTPDPAVLAAWDLRVALVRTAWLERWPMDAAVKGWMRRIATAVAEDALRRLDAGA
jgi:aminoglycoside phosphotransferase (APT) family kinase protein